MSALFFLRFFVRNRSERNNSKMNNKINTIFYGPIIAGIVFLTTGCMEDAQSNLSRQALNLLSSTNVPCETSSEYVLFNLENKQIRISPDGCVDLIVKVAGGESVISINSQNPNISSWYVKRVGVSNISEKVLNSSLAAKEAIVWEAANEARDICIKSKEAVTSTVPVEVEIEVEEQK